MLGKILVEDLLEKTELEMVEVRLSKGKFMVVLSWGQEAKNSMSSVMN